MNGGRVADEENTEDTALAIERGLQDAIADVMHRHGYVATKWIAAIEFLDPAGERRLDSFASPDFRAWDSLGMLGFLDARERGLVGAAAAREHLDDGDQPDL